MRFVRASLLLIMIAGIVILTISKRYEGDPEIVLVVAVSAMAYSLTCLLDGKFDQYGTWKLEGPPARIVASIVLIVAVVGLIWSIRHLHSGSRHEFEMNGPSSPFLTEAVALDSARKALVEDGFDLIAWTPRADGRTAAPDGSMDKFMVRNGENPNHGYILFQNRAMSDAVFVIVEKTDAKVVCTVSRGK